MNESTKQAGRRSYNIRRLRPPGGYCVLGMNLRVAGREMPGVSGEPGAIEVRPSCIGPTSTYEIHA